MQFSLLLATLNRSKEIKECLLSLCQQEYKEFEVIIIDQSEDNLTKNIVEDFKNLNIKYFKVDFKGLSKARNFGIKYANGEYCCLLDDDAIYKKDYLKVANEYILSDVILSGEILSIDDLKTPFVDYNKIRSSKYLRIREVLDCCPSAALIFPMSIIKKGILFNERIGVGNEFAACEETDFILNAIDLGYKVIHISNLVTYHPIKRADLSNLIAIKRHSMGKGALLKIDIKVRKKNRLFVFAMKNTIGMIIKAILIDRKNKNYHYARCTGFVQGYKEYKV